MTTTQRIPLYLFIGFIGALLTAEIPHFHRIHQDPLLVKVERPQLIQDADVIAIGTVQKKLGTVRETVGGEDMVFTRWFITPETVYKGSIEKSYVLRTAGGQYGLTIVDVEDQPRLTTGSRLLLFTKAFPGWKGDHRTVGEIQGVYQVRGSGTAQEVAMQETNDWIPLQTLVEEIDTAAENGAR